MEFCLQINRSRKIYLKKNVKSQRILVYSNKGNEQTLDTELTGSSFLVHPLKLKKPNI